MYKVVLHKGHTVGVNQVTVHGAMVVVLQYSHILQTQTGFISQLSTAYRVTLVTPCHTVTARAGSSHS